MGVSNRRQNLKIEHSEKMDQNIVLSILLILTMFLKESKCLTRSSSYLWHDKNAYNLQFVGGVWRPLRRAMYILKIFVGYGAADFVGPSPSGSVIANFEGTINATTLTCNVTVNQGAVTVQLDTLWSFANFRGVAGSQSLITLGSSQNLFLAGGPFLNELTVTNWTTEVDQVIVFCGSDGEANVTLRIYREFKGDSHIILYCDSFLC